MTKRRLGASGSSDSRSLLGPEEVRLQHGADVVVTRLAQPAVDAERRVDDARLLHVDPDEAAEPLRDLDDPLDVRVRDLLVELEAEMGQLERDVRTAASPRARRSSTRPYSSATASASAAVADALAEERRVRVEPLLGEATQDGDALVEVSPATKRAAPSRIP